VLNVSCCSVSFNKYFRHQREESSQAPVLTVHVISVHSLKISEYFELYVGTLFIINIKIYADGSLAAGTAYLIILEVIAPVIHNKIFTSSCHFLSARCNCQTWPTLVISDNNNSNFARQLEDIQSEGHTYQDTCCSCDTF
jgi:hypothetical protein